MKKLFVTTILCFSGMSPIIAQNITGQVTDTKGEPLAFANIVLLNRQDSVFINGRYLISHSLDVTKPCF